MSRYLATTEGMEMRLWFGQDLKDSSESDNSGTTCAHVYAIRAGITIDIKYLLLCDVISYRTIYTYLF